MDYFENKINKVFNDTEGFIPPGYSWEEMKPGIQSKMNKSKSSKKIIYFFVWGVSAILIFFLIYGILSSEKNKDKIKQNLVEKINLKNQIKENEINYTNEKNYNKNNGKINEYEDNENLNTTTTEIYSIATTKPTNKKSNDDTNSTIPMKKIVLSFSSIDNKEAIKIDQHINHDNNKKLYKNKLLNLLKLKKNIYVKSKPSTLTYGIEKIKKLAKNKTNKKSVKGISYIINLESGTNLLFGNHTNSKYIDNLTKSQLGYYTNFSIELLKKTNWNLSLGYNYNNYISLFKFKDFDQVQKTFTNVVLFENTNSLTNRSSKIRGDTTVLRNRNREIAYYNNFKTYSLILGIGKNFPINNSLNLIAKSRLTYMFKLENEGVLLDNNRELIYFNNGETFYKSSKLAIGFGIGLEYKINSNWMIGSTFRYDKYITNWYQNTTIKYFPSSINLGLNVKYKF